MTKVVNRTLLYTQRFAIHLVTYKEGHAVPHHFDLVENGQYYKLNIVIVKPKEGGVFQTDGLIFSMMDRLFFFRPDLFSHHVTKIIRGKRIVLSFAFHLNAKAA
ncbi:hypothetical protein [Methylophaga sulfidovorans]|uniref:2OG-Fe(II) oxygenase superfamily protein n=1 Tax=Methylophaga sulfidovorans TaxID=45496 RepID=A0A1I4B5Q2_9GAMM|nr:hypothetical protein [Methylophaga sulfidovorans]SFK64232.1 hypothetical protein SAMN04488079_11764 [Methylophaga sulfidovorans]